MSSLSEPSIIEPQSQEGVRVGELRSRAATLRMHHRCMWATIFHWRGDGQALWREHGAWLRQLAPDYRRRVVQSAIRTPTFLRIVHLALRRPYSLPTLLRTGILAALFDDLFDLFRETPEDIGRMILHPETAEARDDLGRDFLRHYLRLREDMPDWQRQQLARILEGLARAETRLLAGEHWDGHWQERGTAALAVYLTVVGVPRERWNAEAAACFGEYLQMMDDYEDYGKDPPQVNYFHHYPEADVTEHFLEVVAPTLGRLFSTDAGTEANYDAELFTQFMESYHLFIIDHNHERVYGRPPPAVDYPWVPAQGPLNHPGLLTPVWWYIVLFTTAFHRFLPRRYRLPLTRMGLQLLGWP